MTVFTARVAAPGTALGFVFRTDRPRSLPDPRAGGPDDVRAAFDAVAENLAVLAADLRLAGRSEEADIMEVGGQIAADADLRAEAIKRTEQGVPAGVAIHEAAAHYADLIASLGDPVLAERAADVRQVGRRAVAWLYRDADGDAPSGGDADAGEARDADGPAGGVRGPGAVAGREGTTGSGEGPGTDAGGRPDAPIVLIAEEIGAADLLEAARVVAAVSVKGGPNSHAAIVARSLTIPLLTGVDSGLLELADGVEVLVDGAPARGIVRSDPPAAERRAALAGMAESRRRRAAHEAERSLDSRTLDGHAVTLRANVATPADVRAGLAAGADGVGLLRTELPFLDAASWPTLAQHTSALRPLLRELAGRPVTVRTLDFADDKLPPFLVAGRDGRLGRGLPLMLAEPAAFTAQFTAMLSAAPAGGDLRIMIPMVADLAELRACARLLAEAATALGVAAPPLGVMIELSEAVEGIDELAAEAAFLSIGSNDLTGRILGLDRRDPAATPMMTAHPRVLAAIDRIVRAGRRHGRQVSVCGDAAAHPVVMPLLVGLGCEVLSVAPAALDEIRYRIRRLRHDECRALAETALGCADAEQVWRLVDAPAGP
ncbi:putative PEP-binding protein [Actinomadura scrupuli]|uniref:putative PEP-binding protein n=1 Tax=Actinomadura scrupuli TaxID=559629 RepID=UPI003D9758A4